MIKIALCDDEEKILSDVSFYIKKYMENNNKQNIEIYCFNSVCSIKNALDDGNIFDIFILDVYIKDEIGTVLSKDIRKRGIDNPIIFLTSSLEHAPISFETNTLRYLLKPLNPQKLYEALDVAIEQVNKSIEKLLKLKTESGIESINADHILFTEAHGHYQYITFEDLRKIRVRMTVSELYILLMKYNGFVRVGSAYIINLRNVKNVSTSEVHLYNDINIPIPRGKHLEIKKSFWVFQYGGEGDK